MSPAAAATTAQPSSPLGAHDAETDSGAGGFAAVAGNSASVAIWTAVSRATGFLRVITIAAVLGPTYFANTFQAMNLLPNATYELLTGSLIASMLVPALVSHVDLRDRVAAERIAGGFMGVLLLVFAGVVVLFILTGPLLSRLFVLGVDDPEALALQQRTGWLLLVLIAPQLIFYGVVGTGAAAQNALGRFALAAGAPVIENVGVIVTLIASAVVFGTGGDLAGVPLAQVVLLGVGATLSVAAHAALQWWGAKRAGLTLRPRAGWRDPDVRSLARVAVPSLGLAGLFGFRYLAILVVAGSVPGGVVAFTMAVNFFNLPVALGAKPVAAALLPRLARLAIERRYRVFRNAWTQGIGLAFFFAVPAAVAYLALCVPLASAVAFGEMATDRGVALIAVSLAALACGLVGETVFQIGIPASYAMVDPRAPLRAVALRTVCYLPGMGIALAVQPGPLVLLALGITLTIGDVVAGVVLTRHLQRSLPAGGASVLRPLIRSAAASLVMIVPAGTIAWWATTQGWGAVGDTVAVVVAVAVGLVTYLAVQMRWNAPEPRQLSRGLMGGSATA